MNLAKLTPEQEKLMYEVRDEWMDYLFSCKNKLDKEKATIGINKLYNLSGLKKPEIIYLSSPLALQYAANLLLNANTASVQDSIRHSALDSIRDSVWDSIDNSVLDSVLYSVQDSIRHSALDSIRDSVWDSIDNSVLDSVLYSVQASIEDSVWDSIGVSVWHSVWTSIKCSIKGSINIFIRNQVSMTLNISISNYIWSYVEDSVWNYIKDYVSNSVSYPVLPSILNSVENSELNYFDLSPYGSISDFEWVAFYDFFERIGIFKNHHFTDFKNLLKSGIYDIIVFDGLCLVCELPTYISRDNRGQLHNEKKHSIEWSDGFKIWKWKGADVPQKLIETPELITKEDLKNNQNTEVRRAFIEKLGVSKYFDILSGGKGLELIDQDTDDQGYPMKLMQFDFGEGEIQEKIQVLEVTCPSTKRIYNLYPPNQKSKNVWEAKSSTFNNEKLTYRHGDVGLVKENSNNNKPLIET